MMISEKKYTQEQEQLARFAKAMGHPIRVAILQLLAGQNCCYHGDLSEVLPVAKSTLSQHLKELKEAGLIKGEINPPLIRYCIDENNFKLLKTLFNGLLKEINIPKECCD